MTNRELDFRCLVCGAEHPTVTRMQYSRGDHYGGNSKVPVLWYDLSRDSYLLKIANPDLLKMGYEKSLELSVNRALAELRKKVDRTVSDEEFKQIVLDQKINEIQTAQRHCLRDFEYPILSTFSNYAQFGIHHGYAVDSACFDLIISSAENRGVEEIKCVIENREKKLLVIKAELDASQFNELFRYFTGHLSKSMPGINLRKDMPPEKLVLEFKHFSELGK